MYAARRTRDYRLRDMSASAAARVVSAGRPADGFGNQHRAAHASW